MMLSLAVLSTALLFSGVTLYSTTPVRAVFSNLGMSLERPEVDDAKRVDPL